MSSANDSEDVPTPSRPAGSVVPSGWPAGVQPTAEYEAALRYLREETGHLFVTGRAGTGKSTLLRALRDLLSDEAIVVAPTGLAAVNVGGHVSVPSSGRM